MASVTGQEHGEPRPSSVQSLARAAMSTARCPRCWLILIGVTLIALAADLVSKEMAFSQIADAPVQIDRERVLEILETDPRGLAYQIPRHEPVKVIPNILHFTLVLNPGAVFGIGAGKRLFFIFFTGVAIVFALFVFTRWTTPRDRAAHVALGLLIAGGLGNLYDRMVFGCVRDFIHPLPHLKYPFGLFNSAPVWPWVSNVADLFLIIGIAMLAIFLLRKDKAAAARDQAASGGQTTAT